MNKKKEEPEFKKEYNVRRKKQPDLVYRINKRVEVISYAIKKNFSSYNNLTILDVGCADGLVLSKLNKLFNFKRAVGIDLSKELIMTNADPKIHLKFGNATDLSMFKNDEFDIVFSTAVIEHVLDPKKMIEEIYRVLKKQGVLIMTEANPFYCRIGELLGYFKEPENTLWMWELSKLMNDSKFKVIEKRYFGFNPFFKLPGEKHIEGLVNILKLGPLISNQLIIGKK